MKNAFVAHLVANINHRLRLWQTLASRPGQLGKLEVSLLLLIFSFTATEVKAQKATWIWYPGDYELWLANKMENRRTDRGSFFPVFWKVDSHYPLMDFHKDFTLNQSEDLSIYVEGLYNVKLDGKLLKVLHDKSTFLRENTGST